MSNAQLLLLVAVVLPPKALTALGTLSAEKSLNTPYGAVGPIALRQGSSMPPVWVLPYSGLPTRTDPRATIYAAQELQVRYLLNWDEGIAVNPMLRRGQPVIPMDYIDWTRHQPTHFVHDPQADLEAGGRSDPSPSFAARMTAALSRFLPGAPGAVYLGIDGPRRETPAEARMFRAWNVDVMGQNLVPEVYLAKESGLAYAGLVTVVAHSADQIAAAPQGALRSGLELVTTALPDVIRALAE